ncbi:MAG: hypothetical protein F6K58_30415 [Symploca sp. SIO2E9]|nr:hypothetical protein [Symploca sp. SIO2E9]
MLTPAARSLPDASVWSHNSLRAAMAGTLATYRRIPQVSEKRRGEIIKQTRRRGDAETRRNQIPGKISFTRIPQKQQQSDELTPRPYLAIFSFTPVQEIVKSSRKMRDFWAGSWVLHYL